MLYFPDLPPQQDSLTPGKREIICSSSGLTYSSFRHNEEASSHDSAKYAEPGYKSAVSFSEVEDKQGECKPLIKEEECKSLIKEECKPLIKEVTVKTIGPFFLPERKTLQDNLGQIKQKSVSTHSFKNQTTAAVRLVRLYRLFILRLGIAFLGGGGWHKILKQVIFK